MLCSALFSKSPLVSTLFAVITNNGHSAFVWNTASGTISNYDLTSNDGTLTLVNSVAGDNGRQQRADRYGSKRQ